MTDEKLAEIEARAENASDSVLTVHARTDLSALVAEVRRLRKREPTREEMLRVLGGADEAFFDGWTVRRCRHCREPVAGGPTACVRCVEREEVRRLLALLGDARGEFQWAAGGFDCDADAHRYGTPCRACDADKMAARIDVALRGES